ncbi:MerR family transcriptional regulator [Flavitalea sp.]|nr:MerR family transcriptional regulator [Flavitalea sp.]
MKNSTQITLAFQDTPESGDNPGVGVRIKSLKKGANEKGTNEKGENESAGEAQPEAKILAEKPAEPKLFDETTADQVTEGQNPLNQTDAQAEALPKVQTEIQTEAHSGQTEAQTEAYSYQTEIQTEAQNSNSEALPRTSIEDNSDNQDLANLAQQFHQLKNQTKEYTDSSDQIDDQTGNLTGYQIDDQTGFQTDDQTENGHDSVNDNERNEEDADLPVFRRSTLSAGLSEAVGNLVEDSGVGGNEFESQEGDEQADSNSVTEKASKSTRGRKSLKTIDEGAELINIPPDEVLFRKQYYAIGEVAEMFHVNQSLLRFWETEFDIIQPRKNRKGDRHFRPVDIKNLLLIHDLLRRRKLTIEGAKDFLKKNKRSPERFAMIQSLQKIKGFILEIKATL